jgi:hypothetical protein
MAPKPTPSSVVALGAAGATLTVAAVIATASFWPEGSDGNMGEKMQALTLGGIVLIAACVCWAGTVVAGLLGLLVDVRAATAAKDAGGHSGG